jgi:DNA mismatch endonuclease, patch repair protein
LPVETKTWGYSERPHSTAVASQSPAPETPHGRGPGSTKHAIKEAVHVDTLTPERRSALMSRIRSTGTTPERLAEDAARHLRRRPATHVRSLPGRPDMVFPRSKAAVFVHGCFWHQHKGCAKARVPKTNKRFWEAKFAANRLRDRRAARELRRMGWRVLTVWECETKDAARLQERLGRFLRND